MIGSNQAVFFATFHDTARSLNCVTGPHCDRMVGSAQYKVTAIRILPS